MLNQKEVKGQPRIIIWKNSEVPNAAYQVSRSYRLFGSGEEDF